MNKESLALKVIDMLINADSKNGIDQSFKTGDKVLVRAHQNGVQVGKVKSHVVGGKLVFSECRKLWGWAPKKGLALESLAVNGADESRTRATEITTDMSINDSDCVGIMILVDEIYEQIMSLEASKQS